MDTVYGTKKYFQSLGNLSDYYRSANSRAMTNEYSSYQNTMGRQSTLRPYTPMGKMVYPDTNLHSNYHNGLNGYSTWNMWRDSRTLAPSSYSSKSTKSVKSFSIILITAAFIVVLAVISVAGLAFYFSTFKSDNDDSILVFDGKFAIARGDLFTTGLKYNHTSVYRQKSEYYETFITQALQNNGLSVAKCELQSFGDGPLLTIHFRLFLDMRRVPIAIKSVEDHIKNSILNELHSGTSLDKSIKIDIDTIEVKRFLDNDLIKSASLFNEYNKNSIPTHPFSPLSQQPPSSPSAVLPTSYEERVNKKSGIIEKTLHKFTPNTGGSGSTPMAESGASKKSPSGVIQGSFEVTKTEADITQKRTSTMTTATLRPIGVTNRGIKVKPKKPTVEKIQLSNPSALNSSPDTDAASESEPTIQVKPLTTPLPSMTKVLPIQVKTTAAPSSTPPTITTTTTSTTTMTSTKAKPPPTTTTTPTTPTTTYNPPRLDGNLFTIQPKIDTEPWMPINPITSGSPTNYRVTTTAATPIRRMDSNNNPAVQMTPSTIAKRPIYYQGFTHPTFSYSNQAIEQLGSADVKPYPIPVNKINEEVIIPEFKYIDPSIPAQKDLLTTPIIRGEKDTSTEAASLQLNNEPPSITSTMQDELSKSDDIVVKDDVNATQPLIKLYEANDEDDKLGEFLLGILEGKYEDAYLSEMATTQAASIEDGDDVVEYTATTESIRVPTTTQKLNFNNIKSHILSTQKLDQSGSKLMRKESTTVPVAFIDEFIMAKHGGLSDIQATTDDDVDEKTTAVSDRDTTFYSKSTVINNESSKISTKSTRPVHQSTIKQTPQQDGVTFQQVFTATSPIPTSVGTQRTTTTSTVHRNEASPTSMEQQLFPSNEFSNVPSFSNGHHMTQHNMKKVFNDTLQAWIIENPQKANEFVEKVQELTKYKQNVSADLQNISSMFDSLAVKLAISPNGATNRPPFVPFGLNKLRNKTAPVGADERINSKVMSSQSTVTTTTTTILPILLYSNVPSSIESVVIGEAEIEEVDPTQYEEMLKKEDHTSTEMPMVKLVTLLPVKSNSGIRKVRIPLAGNDSRGY